MANFPCCGGWRRGLDGRHQQGQLNEFFKTVKIGQILLGGGETRLELAGEEGGARGCGQAGDTMLAEDDGLGKLITSASRSGALRDGIA